MIHICIHYKYGYLNIYIYTFVLVSRFLPGVFAANFQGIVSETRVSSS